MSATLHELRSDLAEAREIHGRRSSHAERAFNRLVKASAEAGTPLDGLRHHTANEVERFFSWTIQGPDGHVYWDGPSNRFYRNDGGCNTPRRWWFNHVHGDLTKNDDLAVKCGERNCINPEHVAKERTRGFAVRYSDDQIFGALKVMAIRLGKTPSSKDWLKSGRSPKHSSIEERYGSWARAIELAGLPPVENIYIAVTPDRALAGIRFAKKALGYWPSSEQYQALRDKLRAAGHPTSSWPAQRLFGSWPKARRAAGAPENIYSEAQKRSHASRDKPSREDTQPRKG